MATSDKDLIEFIRKGDRVAMKQLYMVMAGAAYSMGRLLCVVAGVPAPAMPGRGII